MRSVERIIPHLAGRRYNPSAYNDDDIDEVNIIQQSPCFWKADRLALLGFENLTMLHLSEFAIAS